ncbi:hypothetical protein AHAS_Ahas17G0246400 [Arachis hypogaea]
MMVQEGEGARETKRCEDRDENHEDIGDNHSETLEDQMLENKKMWELVAAESGAVLYNEDDDIMTILQAQNEEIALKRRLAKQKAKTRRYRPKHKSKVCNNILK